MLQRILCYLQPLLLIPSSGLQGQVYDQPVTSSVEDCGKGRDGPQDTSLPDYKLA